MYGPGELAQAKADFAEAFLTDTVTVIREARTRTDAGGTAITTSTSTVPGRLLSPHTRGKEQPAGGQIGAETDYLVHVLADVDVRRTDRLDVNGVRLEILSTDRSRSEALMVVCQCKKL